MLKKMFIIFSSIFLVLGVIFLGYIIIFICNAKTARGVVTDSKITFGSNLVTPGGTKVATVSYRDRGISVTPKVKYEINGKIYEKYSNLSSPFFTYKEGDILNIMYNPKNPSDFMIDTWNIWVIPAIFSFLGLFGLFFTLALYRMENNNNLINNKK